MTARTRSRPHLSWRTHCTQCGVRKAKVWGPGRTTLSKHCPNQTCGMFGIPQLVTVRTIVTIGPDGKRHVSHKEVAIRRRPTFAAPEAPQQG
jgi:hypothetical protein